MRNPTALAAGRPPTALGAIGTLTIHALAVATLVLGRQSAERRPMPIAYRVNLVAAPAAAPAAAAAAAAPAPQPEPPASRPEVSTARRPAPRTATPTPAPAPARTAPARTAPPTTAAPARPATPAAAPTAAPGSGSDVATVRTEGVEFPFPGYLRNLVAQVYRRWSPPPGNTRLEAEIFFMVHRDGSVTGIQFITRSGSFAFDLEAQGAIEAAARTGAFGALPAGYASDVLPVSFFFSPRNVR